MGIGSILAYNKNVMAKRYYYRKDDVDTRNGLPCVNVKLYNYGPSLDKITAKFGCTEEVAQRALEWAWESDCQQFWESFEEGVYNDLDAYYFPNQGASVEQNGRSGGWLVVHGLKDVDEWDAIDLMRWAKFEKSIRAEVKGTGKDHDAILKNMEHNRWCETDAQQYNFIDLKDAPGKSACIADIERIRREAGDAAVTQYIEQVKAS